MLPQLTEQPARAATATRGLIGTDRGPAQWGADRRRGSREFTKPTTLTRADAVEGRATKALRPPVDLADATHRAEVSLATASAITEKALLDYREGAAAPRGCGRGRRNARAVLARSCSLSCIRKNHTIKATAERNILNKSYTHTLHDTVSGEGVARRSYSTSRKACRVRGGDAPKELREAREAQQAPSMGAELAKVTELENN